jgi:predicted Zn-dependent protease
MIFLIAGLVLTGVIVRGYKARQQQLAQRWFTRGDRNLARGASPQAVDDFQTALAYAPENDAFRLELALALMQAGREDEARVHLVNLWEARPGDSNVNLQLARVMARLGHSQDAVRYYHGSIYGVWGADPLARRQEARFELANYLLSTRQPNEAESELIALAAESPGNPQDEIQLGNMFMEAGDPTRALSAFLHGRRGPHDVAANLGAARAAFSLHRFRDARDYAREAHRTDPKIEEASAIEDRADLILKVDPQTEGLNARDRAQRAYAAYSAASERLDDCSEATEDPGLEQLSAARQTQFRRLSVATAFRDPDLQQQAVQWAYDVEKATESACGAPTGLDATLLMLAHYQGVR